MKNIFKLTAVAALIALSTGCRDKGPSQIIAPNLPSAPISVNSDEKSKSDEEKKKDDKAKKEAEAEKKNLTSDRVWRVIALGKDRKLTHFNLVKSLESGEGLGTSLSPAEFEADRSLYADFSKYEINPYTPHKLKDEDNPNPTQYKNVYFVNQKYSTYATWDNANQEGFFIDHTYDKENILTAERRAASSYLQSKPQATYTGLMIDTKGELGNITLNADFDRNKVSGEASFTMDRSVENELQKLELVETDIDATDGNLSFQGKAGDGLNAILFGYNGNYTGMFVGPNAEEVVGGIRYKAGGQYKTVSYGGTREPQK